MILFAVFINFHPTFCWTEPITLVVYHYRDSHYFLDDIDESNEENIQNDENPSLGIQTDEPNVDQPITSEERPVTSPLTPVTNQPGEIIQDFSNSSNTTEQTNTSTKTTTTSTTPTTILSTSTEGIVSLLVTWPPRTAFSDNLNSSFKMPHLRKRCENQLQRNHHPLHSPLKPKSKV